MLLDSSLIIYATQPAYADLRTFIAQADPVVSAVSYVEVLGYHRLTDPDKHLLEAFFTAIEILPIGEAVIQSAIALRQQKRMSLGDALVAATALTYKLTLLTHNTQDFSWIDGLQVMDPLEGSNP